jgi:hypothetical protein
MQNFVKGVGGATRRLGQALESLGLGLQGGKGYRETCECYGANCRCLHPTVASSINVVHAHKPARRRSHQCVGLIMACMFLRQCRSTGRCSHSRVRGRNWGATTSWRLVHR